MEQRLDKVTRNIISRISHWTGPETLIWKKRDIKELLKRYKNKGDEDIEKYIYFIRLRDFMKNVTPPKEFYDAISEELLNMSPFKPSDEEKAKFDAYVDKYTQESAQAVDLGVITDFWEECAINYKQIYENETQRKMMYIHWLLNAILYDKVSARKLADLEFEREMVMKERFVSLLAPPDLVKILMRQDKDMYERMIATTNAKTYLVQVGEGLDGDAVAEHFEEHFLRDAAATDVSNIDVGDITDPRLA